MCWTTAQIPKELVAKEPIPIFKIGNDLVDRFRSAYRGFDYKLNRVYRSLHILKVVKKSDFYEIDEGFHSYDFFTCYVEKDDYTLNIRTNEGDAICYYTATSSCIKVLGYIPTGAHYYRNEVGEIVSEAIVLGSIPKDNAFKRFAKKHLSIARFLLFFKII